MTNYQLAVYEAAAEIVEYCFKNDIWSFDIIKNKDKEFDKLCDSIGLFAHAFQLINDYNYFIKIRRQISDNDMSDIQKLAISVLEQYHNEKVGD